MRHLRRTVLATFAIALCAAPAASAHDRHQDGGGAVVAPARGGGLTGGELLAKGWSVGPFATEDPFSGSCVTLARNVIAPHFGDDGTATCAATQRTRLFVYFGTACFNVEEGVGETEEEQLACAVAADQAVQRVQRHGRRRRDRQARQATVRARFAPDDGAGAPRKRVRRGHRDLHRARMGRGHPQTSPRPAHRRDRGGGPISAPST